MRCLTGFFLCFSLCSAPWLLLGFYFIPALFSPFFLHSVFIKCCECMRFSFCFLGCLHTLITYGPSHRVVYVMWWFCRAHNSTTGISQQCERKSTGHRGRAKLMCCCFLKAHVCTAASVRQGKAEPNKVLGISHTARCLQWEERRSRATSPSASFCSSALPLFNASVGFSFLIAAPGTPILPLLSGL